MLGSIILLLGPLGTSEILILIIGIIIFMFVPRMLSKRTLNSSNTLTSSEMLPPNMGLRGKTKEQKQIVKYFNNIAAISILDILLGWWTMGIWFVILYLQKMSDSTFDSLLDSKAQEVASRIVPSALEKHGIDADEVNEIQPILVENYYKGSRYFKICKDYTFRASEYQMTYLMFSNKQMYAYSYIFDLTSAETTETTKEYFFQDITNIEITKEQREYPAPRPLEYIIGGTAGIIIGLLLMVVSIQAGGGIAFLGFLILIAGIIVLAFLGFSRRLVDILILRLTVSEDEFVCAMNPENIDAIQGMKAKIREKKH